MLEDDAGLGGREDPVGAQMRGNEVTQVVDASCSDPDQQVRGASEYVDILDFRKLA